MEYFIGIDGGGTKTIFMLVDERGCLSGIYKTGNANYKQIGEDGLLSLLVEGIQKVCSLASVQTACIHARMHRH